MKAKSPPRMQVIKREDKEQKLTAFIIEQFDRMANDAICDDQELSLVALSVRSPVIAALKAAGRSRDLTAMSFRLILASMGDEDLQSELQELPPVSVSWANNARLLDAHEQLVVSDTACWTGDCMRREPTKRDAYECFADDCAETAAWAKMSFERLWAASTPILVANGRRPSADFSVSLAANQIDAAGSEAIAGTRH